MKLAYIDASIWIAQVEGIPAYQQITRNMLRNLRKDKWLPCISEVVVLETLCKPYQENNQILIAAYNTIFDNITKLKVFDEIFKDALLFTQKENLKPMDAVHLAFAAKYGCARLVTTDPHFKNLKTITPHWLDLSQAVPT